MKNSKSTKRALVASVLTIMVCTAMLVGSTFAWFTDTTTSGVNKIQAGALKVAIQSTTDGTTWTDVGSEPLQFVRADDSNDAILWEPGCTYMLPTLRIANKGNLAFKYKLLINGFTGVEGNDTAIYDLAEVIDVYNASSIDEMTEDNNLGSLRSLMDDDDGAAYGVILPTGAESDDITNGLISIGATEGYTMMFHMQETAGNQYQNMSLSSVSFTVITAQYTYEKDSFDDQYDKDIEYPVIAKDQQTLNTAIGNATNDEGKTKIFLLDGEYVLESGTAQNKNITISGTQDTKVSILDSGNQYEMSYQNGATLTFDGITVLGQSSGNYGGIAHVNKTTFINCTIEGKLTLYGDATFINCDLNNQTDYSIWTWGARNVEFIGCTFNSGGKALLVYGTQNANVVVNDCTFIDNGAISGKAAIETGDDYGVSYNLIINNTTVTGFDVNPDGTSTGTALWANKKPMDIDYLNVVIDGVDVY